jgi:hypothetical protein
MSYTLDNITYKTKKAVQNKCREILYSTEDLVDPIHYNFLLDLVLTHHKAEQLIVEGILAFVVDTDTKKGTTKCFYVVTNKYKRIEFSFNKCLLCNPIDVNKIKEDPDRSKILKLQQWFKRFKLNSRRWIEPQITEFRKTHKRVCSVSGATDEKLHVDHVYPLTYHQLVYNYILQMPFHWTEFEIPKEHETNKYTEDFFNYHKQVAQLRYLTKTLNLKHPKSKLVDVVQFFKTNNLL